MISIRNPCLDENRYRIVVCNGVAAVFVGEDGILNISKYVDPMVYPLIFPFGGSALSSYMKSLNSSNSSNKSAIQYYKYVLGGRKCFNRFLNLERITQ